MSNRVSNSLLSSRFFQIYAARALRKPSSMLIYILCVLLVTPICVELNDLFESVLDLDQMQKAHGAIIRVQSRASRSNCGDTVTIKNAEGALERYRIFSSSYEYGFLENHIGKEVVIWSQTEWSAFEACHTIYQLQYGDELIRDYHPIKLRRLAAKEQAPKIISYLMMSIIAMLTFIYFRFRNETSK